MLNIKFSFIIISVFLKINIEKNKMDINTSNFQPNITEFNITNNNNDYFRRRVISVIDIIEMLNLATLENVRSNTPDPNSVALFELE